MKEKQDRVWTGIIKTRQVLDQFDKEIENTRPVLDHFFQKSLVEGVVLNQKLKVRKKMRMYCLNSLR